MDLVITWACSSRGKIGHRLDVRHYRDWQIVDDVILSPGWVAEGIGHSADLLLGDFDFEAIINRASGDLWNQAVFFY